MPLVEDTGGGEEIIIKKQLGLFVFMHSSCCMQPFHIGSQNPIFLFLLITN